MEIAVKYLVIVSGFYMFCGISYIFQSFLRGVNYVAVPTTASIVELVIKKGLSDKLNRNDLAYWTVLI